MKPFSRLIPLQGVKNFRDMGGYDAAGGRTTRWRRLFRSGHLAEMDTLGRQTLQKYGISTVIDFRSSREMERNKVIWTPDWQPSYHPTSIGGNAAAWVQELYERLATSEFPARELRDQFILAFQTIPIENAEGLKSFFTTLAAKSGGAALFHCTAGKDRTGIAGALLLGVLGVGKEQIMEDFLQTNDAVDLAASSDRIADWLSEKAGRAINPNDVHPLVGVEPAFLEAAYASINDTYGSLDRYLETALDITPEKRQKLKDLFLEA